MANKKSYGMNHKWVEIKKSGSLLIRFTYQGIPYQLAPVKGGRSDNPNDLLFVNNVASEIEIAIKTRKFEGLDPWKPKLLVETAKPVKPVFTNLRTVWEQYKLARADKVSKASQISVWEQVDRCLDYLGKYPSTNKVNVNHLLVIEHTALFRNMGDSNNI